MYARIIHWRLFIVFLLIFGASSIAIADEPLPQRRIFMIDKMYHYPGYKGYGDVLHEIEECCKFKVSSPAMGNIRVSLTIEPSGLPMCYMLYPDPARSGCSKGQIKVDGYCYPLGCTGFAGGVKFGKEFTEKLLNENGSFWTLALFAPSRREIPEGDYHIKGTVWVSFQKIYKIKPKILKPLPKKIQPR